MTRVGFYTWPTSFVAPPAFLWGYRLEQLARVPVAGEAVCRDRRTFTVQHVTHDLDAVGSNPRSLDPAAGYGVRVYLLEAQPRVELEADADAVAGGSPS